VIGYGLPSLALFIAVRSLEGRTIRFDRSLAGRVAGALGDSSYSMYLVHPFFLVAATAVVSKVGLASHGWLLTTLLFTGSMVTGWYCYVWLEKPMTQLIARMRRLDRSAARPQPAGLNRLTERGPVTATKS
jgi:peptidoglycan/LPS O-acetylase OafA/YrhL